MASSLRVYNRDWISSTEGYNHWHMCMHVTKALTVKIKSAVALSCFTVN